MKANHDLGFVLLMALVPSSLFADDVLQHHLHATRDGLYIDPLITRAAAATTHRDTTFSGPLPGPAYAQPLFLTNGAGGIPTFIVATEQNIVLALDATSGSQIWMSSLGNSVPRFQLPCGDIDPVGVTGTPVIDAAARIIYVAAMTTDDGTTVRHRIFALSLDDGSTLPGWPLEVTGISYAGFSFDSTYQNQRGALLLSGGILYVPYGGHYGDCGNYHGWVVAVPVNNPAGATAWATGSGAGIWAPGGLSTDGNFVFAASGNSTSGGAWMGGEAVLRLGPGATFSGNTTDYFTPSNWADLDGSDTDVGGSGPLLLDVPGATPSQLAVAMGKNGVVYLLDRNNLGGLGTGDGTTGEGLQSAQVAGTIINAAAGFTAASGTYVVLTSYSGQLVVVTIGASAPPTIGVAWSADNGGKGSPIVTTTDGQSESVVWAVGSEGSNQLQAFNAETGDVLFAGGGPDEQMTYVRRFQTPIVVNGRIFVAGDDQLYAFTTQPAPTPASRRGH